MFKRLFFGLVGLGAGVTLGIWAVRKLERASAKLTPEHVGDVAAARARSLRDRLTGALDDGRVAAAAREAELRLHYRGGTRPDTATTDDPSRPNAL
jgi:hypothetical protein